MGGEPQTADENDEDAVIFTSTSQFIAVLFGSFFFVGGSLSKYFYYCLQKESFSLL